MKRLAYRAWYNPPKKLVQLPTVALYRLYTWIDDKTDRSRMMETREKKGIIRVYESIDMACFRLLLKVATKRPKEREKEQPRKASRWQQYRIWPCRRRAAHIWCGRFVYRGMPFREHERDREEKNQHECVRIKATRLHGFGYRVRYK